MNQGDENPNINYDNYNNNPLEIHLKTLFKVKFIKEIILKNKKEKFK